MAKLAGVEKAFAFVHNFVVLSGTFPAVNRFTPSEVNRTKFIAAVCALVFVTITEYTKFGFL